jgi:Flp pilus assembly protein TadG
MMRTGSSNPLAKERNMATMSGMLIGLAQTARRLRGNRDGVGAVEFALIAPVLIILYMGSLEISVAMSVNKKLARASSTVADLITQEETVNKTYLASMVNVAQSVMTPFRSDGIRVKVTGIAINGAGQGTTSWSWQDDNSRPYSVGSTQSLPSDLAIPNTFLVRTERRSSRPGAELGILSRKAPRASPRSSGRERCRACGP